MDLIFSLWTTTKTVLSILRTKVLNLLLLITSAPKVNLRFMYLQNIRSKANIMMLKWSFSTETTPKELMLESQFSSTELIQMKLVHYSQL